MSGSIRHNLSLLPTYVHHTESYLDPSAQTSSGQEPLCCPEILWAEVCRQSVSRQIVSGQSVSGQSVSGQAGSVQGSWAEGSATGPNLNYIT
jgi:hypothetical protein